MGLQFKTGGPIHVAMSASSFKEIVALWKSPDVLASEIGAGVAAVRKWPQRDNIPAEWWLPILRTKTAQAASLTAEDFAALAGRARDSEASESLTGTTS